MWELTRRLELVGERERWAWVTRVIGGRKKLLVRKEDGSLWLLKLQCGAWLKRYESSDENS